MAAKTYRVPGIHCGHCTMTIERELRQLAGVTGVKANLDSKTVTVEWDTPASEESIKALLAEIHYPASD